MNAPDEIQVTHAEVEKLRRRLLALEAKLAPTRARRRGRIAAIALGAAALAAVALVYGQAVADALLISPQGNVFVNRSASGSGVVLVGTRPTRGRHATASASKSNNAARGSSFRKDKPPYS